MKNYEVIVNENDPFITLRLPHLIVKDLALRSRENGTSIELEISTRLARTLERNLEMIAEDNLLCFNAFQIANKKNHDF